MGGSGGTGKNRETYTNLVRYLWRERSERPVPCLLLNWLSRMSRDFVLMMTVHSADTTLDFFDLQTPVKVNYYYLNKINK